MPKHRAQNLLFVILKFGGSFCEPTVTDRHVETFIHIPFILFDVNVIAANSVKTLSCPPET